MTPHENPQDHLQNFIEIADVHLCHIRCLIGLCGTHPVTILTFKGTKRWLKVEPVNSITSWDDLEKRFISRFFPYGKTTKLRSEILGLRQKEIMGIFQYVIAELYPSLSESGSSSSHFY